MVCYASTASAGNAETDYTGQMQVTVVAPDLTSLSPDNAFANEVVAAIDVTLSTDAPNGGFIGFVSISGTNCAGTYTGVAEVAIPACTPTCAPWLTSSVLHTAAVKSAAVNRRCVQQTDRC